MHTNVIKPNHHWSKSGLNPTPNHLSEPKHTYCGLRIGNEFNWNSNRNTAMHFKMPSEKWQPFCLSLNALTHWNKRGSTFFIEGVFNGIYLYENTPISILIWYLIMMWQAMTKLGLTYFSIFQFQCVFEFLPYADPMSVYGYHIFPMIFFVTICHQLYPSVTH